LIIGVGGKKNAGKDTVGNYLVEEYGFTKLSFAEKGKIVICETFGITREELELWKNDESKTVTLGTQLGSGEYAEGEYETMTFRQYIQALLDEGMKTAYGDLFHVDQLLPLNFQHAGFKYVVCDMRFPFEAMRIKELNGYTCEVVRPNLPDDPHSSEQGLQSWMIDWQLPNTGDIPHIHLKVDEMLNGLLKTVEASDPDDITWDRRV
jgi:hypothetical protein